MNHILIIICVIIDHCFVYAYPFIYWCEPFTIDLLSVYQSLLCLCLPIYSLVWTIYYRFIICLPVYSLVWITYYYVLFGMYKVISLSVSCRRDIFGLNCSESTASFSCCIICEVSHESSQMTVQNGPCLFACALSLRCVWDLRLEFHFSNCPFIHLCESQFIIAC